MAGDRRRRSGTARPGLARAPRWLRPVRRARGAWLSREAEERFFQSAEVLVEGEVVREEGGAERWCGTTMLTVELGRWLGPVPVAARLRQDVAEIAWLLEGSVRVRLRAMRLACAEVARRVPNRSLGRALASVRVRHERGRILLDVDLEVPLEGRGSAGAIGP